MAKVIAAINMTLDGYCDHTSGVPDEALHQHYTALLQSKSAILYGRTTYQLMEYWRGVLAQPTGRPAMDEFAQAIDDIPKIVFSHTLQELDWPSARLATRPLEQEVLALREQPGNDMLVGSPSLIVALTTLNLIDEYQLCVHPLIAGSGLQLFKNIQEHIFLKLTKTKTFESGVVLLCYEHTKKK